LRVVVGDKAWDKGSLRFGLISRPNKPCTNDFSDYYCPRANKPVYPPYSEKWSHPLITCNTCYWTPCNKVANRACMGDGLPDGGPESGEKGEFSRRVAEAEAKAV
jgi:hypothetical protein